MKKQGVKAAHQNDQFPNNQDKLIHTMDITKEKNEIHLQSYENIVELINDSKIDKAISLAREQNAEREIGELLFKQGAKLLSSCKPFDNISGEEGVRLIIKATHLFPAFSNPAKDILWEFRQLEALLELCLRSKENSNKDLLNAALASNSLGNFHTTHHLYRILLERKGSEKYRFNYALSLLSLKRYREGFREYESRLEAHKGNWLDELNLKKWQGQDLTGKTIIIATEQGLGDVIQFITLIDKIVKEGTKIIIALRAPHVSLKKILMSHENIHDVVIPTVVKNSQQYTFSAKADYYCYLMSLPHFLDINLDSISNTIPYLASSKKHFKKWNRLSQGKTTFKIGIVWSTRLKISHDSQHLKDSTTARYKKVINLKELIPALRHKSIAVFSLQKEINKQETMLLNDYDITNLTSSLDNFDDTAAAIEHMDLIISIDTSVAHLAGALGKKVWTLLPYAADWRWQQNRDDCPWYPTMTLIRQSQFADWISAIERVKKKLEEELSLWEARKHFNLP
ncbi:MAG: glycosyltransferase family 9 protein [Endozoicomonas sp.]